MGDTTETKTDVEVDDLEMKGKFFNTLTRTNSKIKRDRAISIAEVAQLKYKRRIEDLEQEQKDLRRDRVNMLDMSPKETTSLIPASDFNADQFVAKDIEIGLKLRNLEIQLEVARASYKNLFE